MPVKFEAGSFCDGQWAAQAGLPFRASAQRSEEGVAPSLGNNMGLVPGVFPPRANTHHFATPWVSVRGGSAELQRGAEGSGWTTPAPSTVRPSPPELLAPGLSSLPHPSPMRIQ